jgi:hypothetical protein
MEKQLRQAVGSNRPGGVPCIWSISGPDSTKEGGRALYGDKLRERGIATLALVSRPKLSNFLQRNVRGSFLPSQGDPGEIHAEGAECECQDLGPV